MNKDDIQHMIDKVPGIILELEGTREAQNIILAEYPTRPVSGYLDEVLSWIPQHQAWRRKTSEISTRIASLRLQLDAICEELQSIGIPSGTPLRTTDGWIVNVWHQSMVLGGETWDGKQ